MSAPFAPPVVAWAGPRGGALFAGSPREVIEKILWEYELLGHDRFLPQIGFGGLPFEATAGPVELLATEVLRVVCREIGRSTSAPDSALIQR